MKIFIFKGAEVETLFGGKNKNSRRRTREVARNMELKTFIASGVVTMQGAYAAQNKHGA
jgi:hypothetical protein